MNNYDTVSLDEAFAQIDARRKAENPWTAADEKRLEAKRAAEQAALAAWKAAHADEPCEEEDDEEDEE